MLAPRLSVVVAVSTVLSTGCVSIEGHNSDVGSGSSGYSVADGSGLIHSQRGTSGPRISVSSAVALSSSAWEWGPGFRAAPGFPLGTTGMTIHPMVSYTYLSFDGGHDNRYEAGGQIRKPLSPRVNGSGGFWIGLEAGVAVLSEQLDGGVDAGSSTGPSITALAGIPVSDSRWGVNLYGGAGLSHYGSTGVQVRAGIDLQPWFLRR